MDKQNIFNNYLDYMYNSTNKQYEQTTICHKSRKCYPLKSWRIIKYKYTPHGFSRLKCLKCGCVWVAHAEYVKKTINIEQQKELFYE